MTIDTKSMSQTAGETAQKIKDRFPGISNEDCGKWAKFIVMTAECVNRIGLQHADTIIKHTAQEYLK